MRNSETTAKGLALLTEPQIQSVAEIRQLESWAMETLGLPSLVLMENAARNIAELLASRNRYFPPPVAIIAGPGNNGGDGLAIARQLDGAGIQSRALLVGALDSSSPECRTQAHALQAAGYPLQLLNNAEDVADWLRGAGCVVDALFGVGLRRPISGPFASAVEAINRSGLPVLAVDVPSGLDADTGAPVGNLSVRANLTACIGGLKAGLLRPEARSWVGELVAVSLGLPATRI